MTRSWLLTIAAIASLAAPAVDDAAGGSRDPGLVATDKSDKSETGCTFIRGVTTCVSEVSSTETEERVVTSGCIAGPIGVPGVRRTTFLDTYIVTEQTITRSHGRSGGTFEITTSRSRVLTSSVLVSSTCEPIASP